MTEARQEIETTSLPIRLQARAVILNDSNEVLLIEHSDVEPADPNEPERLVYWVVPGGGLEEGESYQVCAAREAHEETGISSLRFIRPLFILEKPLRYANGMRMMIEHYILFRCDGKPDVWLNDPGENITDVRWWSVNEMETSGEVFLPYDLIAKLIELTRE